MAFEKCASDHGPAQTSEFPSVEVAAGELPRAIGWAPTTSEKKLRDDPVISRPRVRVAEQALEYIDTHYMYAVHIEDLCRVTGVGVRTLQRCFRDYFQITVSSYLKTVRLEAARRELFAARRSDTSVTRIAMKSGCTHLGRFSVEFRERFGQSPKEMLEMQAPRIV